MPRFSHTKLVKRIAQLDISPENATEYASWIKAGGHGLVTGQRQR